MTLVPEILDMEMPVEGVFHNLVITKIRKDYAGQGQKVMNAMWGAGQMMFNKILVLADEQASIRDYEGLAKYVFANLNPATDIFFSTGPMDVLDHSCSKLGFGGKMCIDGTSKTIEEKDENYIDYGPVMNAEIIEEYLLKLGEIKSMNSSLLHQEIPCLVIAVQKNRKGHVKELHQHICSLEQCKGIKMILYVEHTVDPNDLPTALWRFCNNLDPKRDFHLFKNADSGSYAACMGFDGTRKTKEWDDFNRDWPNIIVADNETIAAVDRKWIEMGIGSFISSPSIKFREQLYGEEAVVNP